MIDSIPLFSAQGADEEFAVLIKSKFPDTNLAHWLSEHLSEVEKLASSVPVILFRGFSVQTEMDFSKARDILLPEPLNYLYRSTPRTTVGEGIMTATEYPSSQEILLHCENAYQRSWPARLVFCCLVPADTGGQTPICDMRKVSSAIGSSSMDLAEKRGIKYIRNYHPGFDLDWQTVFQTDDHEAVRYFCDQNEIDCEWSIDGSLRTSQVCQGVAIHPSTGNRVWFNQAHLFHPSALGHEIMDDMLSIFGAEALPRDACFGDGSQIDVELLDLVRSTYAEHAQEFDWQIGDVLVVDNMLAAHGRRPFNGKRRVLVSMGKSIASGLMPQREETK